jgi:hypothetical protein
MRRLILLVLVLVTALLVFSCDSMLPTYIFTFINYSYYDITISPNGQSWEGFVLYSGTSHQVTTSDNPISYRYNYATVVVPVGSGTGTISFYNRY